MKRKVLFMMGFALPAAISAQGINPESGAGEGMGAVIPTIVATGGGRLFFALLVGILLALAFQWILTCVSVGSGLTAARRAGRKLRRGDYARERERKEREERDRIYREEGRRFKEMSHQDGTIVAKAEGKLEEHRERKAEKHYEKEAEEEEWEKPARKVSAATGLWVLVTCSISLFFACWLSAGLVGFGGPAEDLILSLAVWAGFMFTLMYLEAAVMGSLLGNFVGAIKGGLQAAAAPLKSAAGTLGQKASASADEIAAKVREEFQSQGGGQGLKEKLRGFTESMPARSLDRDIIGSRADELFEDGEIRESIRQSGPVDRRRFQEIASGRSDLSPDERRDLTEVLHDRWNSMAGEGRREPAHASQETVSSPAMAGSNALETPAESPSIDTGVPAQASAGSTSIPPSGSAAGTRLQESAGTARPSGSYASGSPYSGSPTRLAGTPGITARIQAFKDFLRNSEKQELNPVRIEREVESVVIHPEEGFSGMERNVREIKRTEIAQSLRTRRDLTLEESDSIAELVDSARTRMLSRSEIREHRAQEMGDKALSRIRDWAYGLKRPEVDMEGFKGDFSRLLEDPKGATSSLKGRFTENLDRETLINTFAAKKGVSHEEAERMADQAEQAMQRARENAQRIEDETRRRMEILRERALDQAEATSKLAASAAWWLVATAVVSCAAAVLGGLSGAGA